MDVPYGPWVERPAGLMEETLGGGGGGGGYVPPDSCSTLNQSRRLHGWMGSLITLYTEREGGAGGGGGESEKP